MGNELTGCPSMFEFFLVVRLGQSEFGGLKSERVALGDRRRDR
jgi:hypothetical protein